MSRPEGLGAAADQDLIDGLAQEAPSGIGPSFSLSRTCARGRRQLECEIAMDHAASSSMRVGSGRGMPGVTQVITESSRLDPELALAMQPFIQAILSYVSTSEGAPLHVVVAR